MIGVPPERENVGVVGGDHPAAAVGLRAQDVAAVRAPRSRGAGQRLREETGNVAPPVWSRERDPCIDRARGALDAEQADAAWPSAQAMSLDQAVEHALAR